MRPELDKNNYNVHIFAARQPQQNGSTEDLVLIKVIREQNRLRQLMNNHTATLEITVNVHESSVLSR